MKKKDESTVRCTRVGDFLLSTVVLYCWCHSDSASVLLYFTLDNSVEEKREEFVKKRKRVRFLCNSLEQYATGGRHGLKHDEK